MNDGKTKQNKKQKLKSQCKIKHSLFLACAYGEIDARGQFWKHKRSEFLELKPTAILASWYTIYTREEHEPIFL